MPAVPLHPPTSLASQPPHCCPDHKASAHETLLPTKTLLLPTQTPAAAAAGFQPSVRDFDQLKALARRSGGDAAALNRGACKICGGLGHLTKQCRNFLDKGGSSGAAAAAAAGEGGSGAGAAGGGGDRGLLTHADDEALLLNSDSSMESSDLGSGSDSDRERVSGQLEV